MSGQVEAYVSDEADEGPIPLCDLEFTDLFISQQGRAMMRGLLQVADPLYVVPPGAIKDIQQVHAKVCELGQREVEFTIDHDGVRYRVSKIEDEGEPTYVLRRAIHPIPRLRTLGLAKQVYRELGLAGRHDRRGLILFSGPTGAGKTTAAAALLQEYLIQYGGIGICIEDPPELLLSGQHGNFGQCYQVKVKDGDFAGPLRRAMRQAPKYIFLGEIRDAQGATEALQACNSGHVVIATTHAGSIEEAINRLMKLVSSDLDPELARNMLADGLSVVMNQDLKRLASADGQRVERRVSVRSLFFGSDSGLRSMIRDNKIQQIGTEIDAQAKRVERGEMPTKPRPTASR